jgi:predicted pyridoxine 5'-phosphate oxidase superfamily flavin-nucleotide-binding protein
MPRGETLFSPYNGIQDGGIMVKLTEEMKENVKNAPVWSVATASKAGEPNVAPMKTVWLIDDETIWIGDNYMNKTLANLKENPRACIYVWGEGVKGCLQIKGDIEIKTSGPDYEKMYKDIKAKADKYPAKSLIIMKVTDVYTCKPGDGAGAKLL